MRIAVGGIHAQCSTYNPLVQTRADFHLREGPGLITDMGLTPDPDVELIPLFHAASRPGGPVSAQTYTAFRKEFLARLRAAAPLDGVLLLMHGAMHVQGMDDAEGGWVTAIRARLAPDTPIAVSYAPHGNVSADIINAIDIFAAYRTTPHIDVAETHNRALAMLTDALRTGKRYMTAWAPIPLLLPAERTSTAREPARSLYAFLPDYQNRPGVADANLVTGYPWADTPRARAAAIVTGTDAAAIRQAAAEIAQSYWTMREDLHPAMKTADLTTCLGIAATAKTGPVILADSGDNPTTGGAGDRADVLHAVMDRHLTGAIIASIADAPATRAAAAAGEGAEVILTIGGSLGSDCEVVIGNTLVERITGTEGQREAVVSMDGNQIVLTERRRPFHHLADFRRLGLEPQSARLLVVKTGHLSPDLAPLANPALMALTGGAVSQDIPRLPNHHRPNPTWPFQTGFSWHPRPALSARASR